VAFILRDAAKTLLLQQQRRSRCAGMRVWALVVRSAASPRVSNHEASGCAVKMPIKWNTF
jgi:hypothetical protein